MNTDFEANEFAWILEDCLKRLRGGQSPEDCLAVYPDQAEGLQPLLRLAGHLRTVPAAQPRPQATLAGRERMLAASRANSVKNQFNQPVSSEAFSRYTVRIFTFLKTLLFGKETYGMKFALRLAIDLVVILMIGSFLTVNASARSLPGDPLYSVKRTWEEVRLTLTLNDPARQQLQDQIRQLRLDEVREMIQMGKTGVVEFEGQLESIAADEWVVSGMRVGMLPDTIVEGVPGIGQLIRMRARVQNDGTVTALQVRVQMQGQQPAPYQAPISSHTPVVESTPTTAPSHTTWPNHEPAHVPWSTNAYPGNPMHTPWATDDDYNHPLHTPEHTDSPHNDMPGSTSWPNDDHHDEMPGSTPWPNDNHNNDGDHHNSGGSSWSGGGSGSHHP